MLALEPIIVERLKAELPAGAAWLVKGHATDGGDRRPADGPVAVVMFADASVPSVRGTAAVVQSVWTVLLATRRMGLVSVALIDAAFAQAVASLHNWRPGLVAGRQWEPLMLARVAPPQYVEDGLVGLEITFTTSGLYPGQS